MSGVFAGLRPLLLLRRLGGDLSRFLRGSLDGLLDSSRSRLPRLRGGGDLDALRERLRARLGLLERERDLDEIDDD